ncbi:very low-density lipoprotein receptor-like [Ptychodera flava]|uniref:very low-density lipoprotein receptor-like n=1 Tax=Ptychodera flava TaxID=63121 RepID=UPI003969D508
MTKIVLFVTIAISILESAGPAMAACGQDEFQCNSGECIPESYVCDQWPDCPGDEQEDEEGCEIRPCRFPDLEFQCDNGVCIIGYLKCNGSPDCKNGEDEVCGTRCNDCRGWHTIRKYFPPRCEDYGKYPKEPCKLKETCITRLKQRKNGKIKVFLGCEKKKRCNKLMQENKPGCRESPIKVDSEKGCTFCCEKDYCNDYPEKKNVTAL